jgi:hypothetical protein
MLWEVFVTRFQEAFEQYEKHRLTGEEAGELLGMSGRNFRRLCVRYEEDGVEGLRDRRIGKVSPRRASERELERMQELYRERYSDFTVKHFHEQLVKRHNYKLCYTVTKLFLQAAGLAAKAKRRSAHCHPERQAVLRNVSRPSPEVLNAATRRAVSCRLVGKRIARMARFRRDPRRHAAQWSALAWIHERGLRSRNDCLRSSLWRVRQRCRVPGAPHTRHVAHTH